MDASSIQRRMPISGPRIPIVLLPQDESSKVELAKSGKFTVTGKGAVALLLLSFGVIIGIAITRTDYWYGGVALVVACIAAMILLPR